METKPITSKDFFRSLSIVYFAIIAGSITFAIVVFFLSSNSTFSTEIDFFKYLVLLIVIGGVLGNNSLFKTQLKTSVLKTGLLEKLNHYRFALIVKYSILEAGVFFSIVVFLVTADLFFLGLAIIPIFVFIISRPSIEKAADDLDLDDNERQKLLNPDTLLG